LYNGSWVTNASKSQAANFSVEHSDQFNFHL
jgi:hypothetical protein